MEDMDMPVPLCLVENSEQDGLVVREDTVKIISKISHPVVVVAIVGPYRTGKSFLMNRLMDRNDGFALGSTIQSKTKGIWIWCRRHPYKRDHCLILLDTEGLGDVEKGDTANDNWIFSLAILLCSTLVYNNVNSLQYEEIQKLHLITELTEMIKVRSSSAEEEGTEFYKYFPSFVWTVRDFTLRLEIDGQKVTSDEYLENALKFRSGNAKKTRDHNHLRQCIRDFFKERKCFVFDRPVQDKDLFNHLETLSDDQLCQGFLDQAQLFCDYIFHRSMTKSALGRTLNGSSLCNILQMFVKTIQNGQVPCLESAYDAMATMENGKAVEDAFELYKNINQMVNLPTETAEQLSQVHQTSEREAVALFIRRSFNDKGNRHQVSLKTKITEEYDAICVRNARASESRCKQLFRRLSTDIEGKVNSGHYMRPGGYEEYDHDKTKVIQLFKSEPWKGIKAEEALQEFLNSKNAEGRTILATDQALSQQEKEIAENRQRMEIREQEQKAAEQDRNQLEQLLKDQQESNEQNIRQLEKKLKDEREQFLEEYRRTLDQKLKDQQRLMEQGFEDQRQHKEEEIRQLKRKMEESSSGKGSEAVEFGKEATKALLPVVLPMLLKYFGSTEGVIDATAGSGASSGIPAAPK